MQRLLTILIICVVASGSYAGDWPQWRGAKGDGISQEKTWSPEAVSAGKVLWKKSIGAGYSGVAVVGEKVFTLGNVGGNDVVISLDAATGNEAWSFSYPCESPKRYPGPRCTPAVDTAGSSVYVLSRAGELYCIDAAKGTKKWMKNIKADFGAESPRWAFSSSLRIEGDILLVNEGAKGIALNKKTGATIWTGGPGKGGYSSPVVYTRGGKQYVAVFAAKGAYGLDLKTGAEAWSYEWETAYDINAADPVIIGNEVLLSSGYGKGSVLVDISGKPKAVWQNKAMRSHFGSFVVKDGFVYGVDGQAGAKNAELKCFNFKTGHQEWTQMTGFGALVAADDKIILLGEKGKLTVSEMKPDGYKEIATTQLQLGGKCWTMPVLANGRIYCRSEGGDLLCLDVRK